MICHVARTKRRRFGRSLEGRKKERGGSESQNESRGGERVERSKGSSFGVGDGASAWEVLLRVVLGLSTVCLLDLVSGYVENHCGFNSLAICLIICAKKKKKVLKDYNFLIGPTSHVFFFFGKKKKKNLSISILELCGNFVNSSVMDNNLNFLNILLIYYIIIINIFNSYDNILNIY